jgi:hypothetical protein
MGQACGQVVGSQVVGSKPIPEDVDIGCQGKKKHPPFKAAPKNQLAVQVLVARLVRFEPFSTIRMHSQQLESVGGGWRADSIIYFSY